MGTDKCHICIGYSSSWDLYPYFLYYECLLALKYVCRLKLNEPKCVNRRVVFEAFKIKRSLQIGQKDSKQPNSAKYHG